MIATFDFCTLFTKLPHVKVKSYQTKICAAYWGKKTKGRLRFSKTSLKTAIDHLTENCYFYVWNVIMKEEIGIPMGIDIAHFGQMIFRFL